MEDSGLRKMFGPQCSKSKNSSREESVLRKCPKGRGHLQGKLASMKSFQSQATSRKLMALLEVAPPDFGKLTQHQLAALGGADYP